MRWWFPKQQATRRTLRNCYCTTSRSTYGDSSFQRADIIESSNLYSLQDQSCNLKLWHVMKVRGSTRAAGATSKTKRDGPGPILKLWLVALSSLVSCESTAGAR